MQLIYQNNHQSGQYLIESVSIWPKNYQKNNNRDVFNLKHNHFEYLIGDK